MEVEIIEEIKQNAWDELGKTVDKSITTSAEAFKEANLDFIVEKRPLTVKLPNDESVIIPEQYATIRLDTNEILGLVGERYTILQNVDAFSFVDPIVEKGIASYESVGFFGGGERIFINAEINKPILIGKKRTNYKEEIALNLFMTNSHDATGAITGFINPVRKLTNTSLNGALPNKPLRVTFRHTSGLHETVGDRYENEIMEIVTDYLNLLPKVFNEMINTSADEKDYERVIVTALADNPGMVKEYYSSKPSKRFVGNVERVLQFAFTHPTQQTPNTENTVFGIYTALSGYYQLVHEWRSADEKTHHVIDNGSRLTLRTQKCFDECLKLIVK